MVMKYLDPKADLTFKKIFGDHPARLISLLNALQSLSEEELIQQQQYLPTVEELENSGFTDAELRAYDKFWDSVSVERTLLDDRYQKGMTQRSLEIARKMLAKGMDEAMVMEMTGVSVEQIKEDLYATFSSWHIDPYPRFTQIFTLEHKICEFLTFSATFPRNLLHI